MKISYSWLKQWIDTPLTAEEISPILTDTGLEVEGLEEVEKVKGGFKGLVVGEVLTCVQHENADRLRVTTVNIGEAEALQIVCGAPNVAAGQKVIVATVGTELFPSEGEPFVIKKGKIRGEVSLGMICAEDEIGLGKGHDGIMVLDQNAVPGTPAAEFFNLASDTCIEIGLTPNRTDAMSHFGVARDLHAALLHSKKAPSTLHPIHANVKLGTAHSPIQVTVDESANCPKYLGLYISDVEVKASPDWLKHALTSIGLKPINVLVDITNYVMHDIGQALHAFDADVLKGNIRVGSLVDGTKFQTLDELERELSSEDLMICDDAGGLCLAGVFGGLNSGVTENTKNIFLESAYFNPVKVRKTARRHGLNTDSSFRFERGVDPELAEKALLRAANLMVELAGAKLNHAMISVIDEDTLPGKTIIEVNKKRMDQLIGMEIPMDTVAAILSSLDMPIIEKNDPLFKLEAPAYRGDVTREADVVEEVLRIYGFNEVPLPERLTSTLSYESKPNREKYKERLSQILSSRGAMEMMSNSLSSSAYVALMPDAEKAAASVVKMLNPLSSELEVMRQSLFFQGMEAIQRNQNHQNPNIFAYEFGKVYNKFESGYDEQEHLSVFMSGKQAPLNWNNHQDTTGFDQLKAQAAVIFEVLGWNDQLKEKPGEVSFCSDGLQFQFRKKTIGTFGRVNSKMRKHFGIQNEVWWLNLNWELMFSMIGNKHLKSSDLQKFPAVRRDLSFLLDQNVSFAELQNTAFQAERKLLKKVGLFDVYEGDKLEAGKKSYAISLSLQDEEKTLNDALIDKSVERIRTAIEKEHGAVLRS
ncbi:MAG: phenylalanine--tRNA ligase subunit beta [Flavobacteriales bacterium]|nr:phenylalanine--tRNA ligase subunit beta [Flavobacteriales bacterium]MDG1766925.1 phenylalanine--tRNA ligase subunit beta [Flavobacteriales bacterium]